MWRRKVAEIKTIRVTTESWKRVTTENTFRMFGNVSVLFRIIALRVRVASGIKALLMNLQYS